MQPLHAWVPSRVQRRVCWCGTKRTPRTASCKVSAPAASQQQQQPALASSLEDAVLGDVRVILVSPKTAANIGAVARCCSNFEAPHVWVVDPRCEPRSGDAYKVACGGEVMDGMVVVGDLAAALADTTGSIGFTRRAGATRLTHASISHMLSLFPDAIPDTTLEPGQFPPPTQLQTMAATSSSRSPLTANTPTTLPATHPHSSSNDSSPSGSASLQQPTNANTDTEDSFTNGCSSAQHSTSTNQSDSPAAPTTNVPTAGPSHLTNSTLHSDGGSHGSDGITVLSTTPEASAAAVSVSSQARPLVRRRPGGVTALVFGREESGLTEGELRLCSHACAIPTGRMQASMNLSHAVAVVLCELYQRRQARDELLSLDSANQAQALRGRLGEAHPAAPALASLPWLVPLSHTEHVTGGQQDAVDGMGQQGVAQAMREAAVQSPLQRDESLLPATTAELESLLSKTAAIAEAVGMSAQESRGGGNSGNHGRRRLPLGHARALLSRARPLQGEVRSLHGLASKVLSKVLPAAPEAD